jgi:hypothetical protein
MLELFSNTELRGTRYPVPLGAVALLVQFDNRARSCRSTGISDMWERPNWQGIHLGLTVPTSIPWLGKYDLDMAISSTKTYG